MQRTREERNVFLFWRFMYLVLTTGQGSETTGNLTILDTYQHYHRIICNVKSIAVSFSLIPFLIGVVTFPVFNKPVKLPYHVKRN
jgi:hypothetical protein